jgi:hypothetical protein
MSISATAVRFDEYTMWVDLTDARTLGVVSALAQRVARSARQSRDKPHRLALGRVRRGHFHRRPHYRTWRQDGADVARMKRSVIRGRSRGVSPHFAEPVIGRRFAPTRWLHAGYKLSKTWLAGT